MKYSTLLLTSLMLLLGCQSTEAPKAQAPLVEQKETKEPIEQIEVTLEEFCKTNQCRENRRVQFNTDHGPIDQILPLYWPAAMGDKLSILPGDVLLIEAEVIDGQRIGNFKLVAENVNPDKTIRFSFTQMDSSTGMMLSVKNPFPFNIKYHLNMIDFKGKPHQTSSCPVRQNLSVYESWPHPIPELILTDMRILKDGDNLRCIY